MNKTVERWEKECPRLEESGKLAAHVIKAFETEGKYHLEEAERLKHQIEQHQKASERLKVEADGLRTTLMRLGLDNDNP